MCWTDVGDRSLTPGFWSWDRGQWRAGLGPREVNSYEARKGHRGGREEKAQGPAQYYA